MESFKNNLLLISSIVALFSHLSSKYLFVVIKATSRFCELFMESPFAGRFKLVH